MIEQHVFGPDVGQRLWLALKAAPSLEIIDSTLGIDSVGLDELVLQSQGMRIGGDNSSPICAAREKASR